TMLYRRPDLVSRMLDVNADAVAAYLNAQIDAGAQAVMIFDSWGGVLADGAYQQFSLAPMRRVIAALERERDEPAIDAAGRVGSTRSAQVPVIVFTKGGGLWLEDIAGIGCDAVGVDWTVNLGRARARIGDRCALQGNLDPMVLMAEPAQVRAEAVKVLDDFGVPSAGAGHVFNLGHGISQFTPPDNVAALVEAVHDHSRTLRRRDASASSL
ncbi:MAG: uroporphyrinogen decarboxylase, partial [Burkholderiales bacterium]